MLHGGSTRKRRRLGHVNLPTGEDAKSRHPHHLDDPSPIQPATPRTGDLNSYGGSGNDDLTGGPGVDDIDGGTGTNWCTVGSSDSQMRCVYDEAVPVSDEGHLSQDGVDVTQDDREVTARVHVTDDTGVTRVDLGAGDDTTGAGATGGDAELVSGNARDGWWEATLVVPRWSQPGTYVLSVGLRDRVGRWGGRTFPGHTLKVTDRNPDVDRPRSRWSAPARTSPTTCGAAGRTSW